jgi:IMP dehydrogenase
LSFISLPVEVTLFIVKNMAANSDFEFTAGDGFSSQDLFGNKRSSFSAYTYDDIILLPGHIVGASRDVNLETHVTRKLKVKIPLLSSPMDTVTEHAMAIGMALQGAIGVIHYNMTVEEQANEVRLVKKFKNGFITDPACLSAEHSISDVDKLKEKYGYSGIPITVDGKLGSRLIGIVTNRDIDYIEDRAIKLKDVMTTDLITGKLLLSYVSVFVLIVDDA